MRFVGHVVYVKRQDHQPEDAVGDPGPKTVTDVRLDGKVEGSRVYIEVSIPTTNAAAYTIGLRVIVQVRPA